MNLYEIMMEHYAPKDSQKGIYTYLVAECDEAVYEWLKQEKQLKDERVIYNSYKYSEEDDDIFELYDDNYEVVGTETFKERMIRLKGNLYDEEESFDDLYYGKTLLGWKTVKEEITEEEIDVMQRTGISIEVA
ncbi:hypothetical protein ABE073_04760 [Lederbergia citrisecunda]|uniref:hypothetical protein n=1 Tax=Lederbergia citrisecunda TaxID=2833583 RepID=UPI003D26BD11